MLEEAIGPLKRILVGLFALFLVGCGGDLNSNAQRLADPTNQLPPHVNWGSYNLYRYDPGANGKFVKIVSLGALVGSIPALGDHPVLMAHGLGGSISNQRFALLAQNLVDNNLATSIFGFEYDSQDSVANNALLYKQALSLLNPGNIHPAWALISHSMGGLVTRAAVQSGALPIAANGNRVITLATPHFGSPVADAVQTTGDLPTKVAVITALDQGGFTNADGNPCEVDLASAGISDLRVDSPFLVNLNNDIADHAQVNYYTLAGTVKGEFAIANDLLKVDTDDGLVKVASANPPALGAVASATVPDSHTQIYLDSGNTFPLVRQYLAP